MEDCIKPNSKYLHLSVTINNLGWDCFVEGWIPYSLITVIKPMFRWYKPHGSIEIWGTKFINSLISLTHKQWLYRNCNVHYISNGLTSRQHDKLCACVSWPLVTGGVTVKHAIPIASDPHWWHLLHTLGLVVLPLSTPGGGVQEGFPT